MACPDVTAVGYLVRTGCGSAGDRYHHGQEENSRARAFIMSDHQLCFSIIETSD